MFLPWRSHSPSLAVFMCMTCVWFDHIGWLLMIGIINLNIRPSSKLLSQSVSCGKSLTGTRGHDAHYHHKVRCQKSRTKKGKLSNYKLKSCYNCHAATSTERTTNKFWLPSTTNSLTRQRAGSATFKGYNRKTLHFLAICTCMLMFTVTVMCRFDLVNTWCVDVFWYMLLCFYLSSCPLFPGSQDACLKTKFPSERPNSKGFDLFSEFINCLFKTLY